MQKTKIEWADYVWNPITGCTEISEGCKNCYAHKIANRFWKDRTFNQIRYHCPEILKPLRLKKPSKIFVCSMGDLFHKDVPFQWIENVFVTILECQNKGKGHSFFILTKRPERMAEFFKYDPILANSPNVWIGVSVEDQKAADERIPILLQINGNKFVSVEPMLEEIELTGEGTEYLPDDYCSPSEPPERLDWVICGAETGHGARPMNPDWARSLRDQCSEADVPFFFKSAGNRIEIPDDLKIREFPKGLK